MLIDIFRVACYFHSARMQELLVASEIIPNTTPASALAFLKELLKSEVNKRKPDDRSAVFLKDYCFFYISKNLA